MSTKAEATSLESLDDALKRVISENPPPSSAPRDYAITRSWVEVGGVVGAPQYRVEVDISDR
ncbi:hypothetical protein [Leifsonia shinshuensis]|uniref:hypothetical protein n=1 Tax=Leifsonia shinshuensis TaxID=150026 RepID=UPI00286032CA|nr:hypothetical protein [Leifsonia shinshuensis]MDR6971607.1 hypothetical protein [Leifsonia shinshuensis]